MFGLFRPKLSLDQAQAMLVERIKSCRASSAVHAALHPRIPAFINLDEELQFVGVFTVYFHLKFTRERSWRRHGRELFEHVFAGMHAALHPQNPTPSIMDMTQLQDRMQVYALALEVSAGNADLEGVAREVGKSLAMLCGADNDHDLISEGASIFTRESAAMLALFSHYTLSP
jgi:hypothetical protein